MVSKLLLPSMSEHHKADMFLQNSSKQQHMTMWQHEHSCQSTWQVKLIEHVMTDNNRSNHNKHFMNMQVHVGPYTLACKSSTATPSLSKSQPSSITWPCSNISAAIHANHNKQFCLNMAASISWTCHGMVSPGSDCFMAEQLHIFQMLHDIHMAVTVA